MNKDKKKNKKKGFTLIEILVVVVIISILAAIAIPKYQKALEKAHSTEVVNILRNMANAETIYYLANEKYTDDLSKLDIKFPYDYSIVANISGRKYFYGGKFTYAFWYDKTGLWSYKEYKDGLYMLQVNFESEQINCAASGKGKEICFALGFTEYLTTQTFATKTNERYDLDYYNYRT